MIKDFDKDRVDNFWNGKSNSNAWMRGYLEGISTFGVYINPIIKNNGTKYVYIKPMITIVIKDKDMIYYLKDKLKLFTNITEAKRKNKERNYSANKLQLQNKEDIDKIIEVFKDHKFISKNKQGIFDRFKDAYFEILKLDKLDKGWKEFDEELVNVINNYLPIQDSTKKVYSSKEQISRIKKHFSSDEPSD